MGDLLRRKGDSARAAEVLAFVGGHPAAEKQAAARAMQILGDIRAALPDEAFAAAEARGRERRLEELIAELLGESSSQ